MLRAIVIGSPGAGKSTFARKLRDRTGLPLYYLDMLWHKSDQTTHTKAEFDATLQQILQKDSWIIDGNYQRTIEQRLKYCDTVFLLDYPVDVCLAGAESRVGKTREDLPWTETSFDPEFKQFIENFAQDELPQIYTSINKYKDKVNVVIFKSRAEANNYLDHI
ncbi:adenylate kinase [Companilactobacillus kimchii]|uniref:Transcriptional regulator n=2 Tax=Companilactobacillus kimchii TaxID=2801452 RepID=A0ABR5NSF5_9LACO|nr:adenylate kinase [Companilactobacillus kimchii]KAE9562287.1 adenylate kinase [Companilactobacillus kimchii]KRK51084.1 transcriptional regulator [Companilactobacillus kimchii DSM 13961 = JCM 10707]OWF34436.1 hypothetical protein LKACC12383_00349 [Companilactobacillus kimchii]GEO46360.1 adenylate kinase [Companilactobacillus paralimentarius]